MVWRGLACDLSYFFGIVNQILQLRAKATVAPQPKTVSQPEVVLSPRGHLSMSGDTVDGHTWGFLWVSSEWRPGCCSISSNEGIPFPHPGPWPPISIVQRLRNHGLRSQVIP